MACRSCARAGNYGQGVCQSCTLMESMHKPNPALPAKLETPAERFQREYEMQRLNDQQRQQQYQYEMQRRQLEQQRRSPYGDNPYAPQPPDFEMMRQLMTGRRFGGPSPQTFEGKVTKQMYIKIV